MKALAVSLAISTFILSFASGVPAQEADEEYSPADVVEKITVEEDSPVPEKVTVEKAVPATEKKEPFIVMKKVTGEVSAIDKRCIAVVYKHDEATGDYELPVTIKDPPRVEHAKSLDQINPGDTVTVEYEQMTDLDADGKEIIGDKFAKTVIFLKHAPPPQPEKEETENSLDSEQEQ